MGRFNMAKVDQASSNRGYGEQRREELCKEIVRLHDEGMSQVKIARELGVARGTISRWNKQYNLFQARTPGEAGRLASKKYNYDDNYFNNITTDSQAYIIGFIVADGTVIDEGKRKRIRIELAEQDRQLLEDIAKELNMLEAVKTKERAASNEQNKVILTINSTPIADDLISLGLTPKKTGKEQLIRFDNDELTWSFLRGFFDGDGHIRVYERNGYQKQRAGFTGNREMLSDILDFLKENGIAENVNSITDKSGCSDLYISSKSDVIKIRDRFYHEDCLCLHRKRDKFFLL